jgi:DNA topoisomerase-3
MSPTLSLLVQREREISAFLPEPFYRLVLDCGFPLSSEKLTDMDAAQELTRACAVSSITVLSAERTERSEKAPALYDLTTLQREANRHCGFTAQQTLDYLQSLYEKKLCTYPRTDSRYLTNDMESAVPEHAAAAAAILGCELPKQILPKQVCNSEKVSDHHAVIPSLSAKNVDMSTLPAGEQSILMLVATGLLRGICPEYRFAETVVTAECAGHTFRARGKEILKRGWTVFSFRSAESSVLPTVTEGQTIPVSHVGLKGGKTTPPKYYTEDTLLAAMENAGIQDMPEDAERKGIGTPATRSGILEKLISDNFVIRTKSKKVSYLRPTELGIALITVLPEQLQSPLLTAEWEHRLKLVENGTLSDSDFMDGIAEMLKEMVEEYKPYPGSEVLFPEKEDVVGKCPRCGTNVEERKRGFFCQNPNCRFVLWKNSRFFEVKKKKLDKATAVALLKFGQVPMKGCYSEKTGKTYDATAILVDKGDKVDFKLEFDNGKATSVQ